MKASSVRAAVCVNYTPTKPAPQAAPCPPVVNIPVVSVNVIVVNFHY